MWNIFNVVLFDGVYIVEVVLFSGECLFWGIEEILLLSLGIFELVVLFFGF